MLCTCCIHAIDFLEIASFAINLYLMFNTYVYNDSITRVQGSERVSTWSLSRLLEEKGDSMSKNVRPIAKDPVSGG